MNCPHCGARMKDDTVLSLNQVVRNFHVKRALEVALVGNHTVGLIGGEDANNLAKWAANHGLTVYMSLPCNCGNFGSPIRECTCSVRTVTKWRERKHTKAALNAELSLDVNDYHTGDEILDWRRRQGEPDEVVLGRVAQALTLAVPPMALDSAGESLMRAAVNQLPLTNERVNIVLHIAQSIARLAGSETIRPAHLAEAIQYQRREA